MNRTLIALALAALACRSTPAPAPAPAAQEPPPAAPVTPPAPVALAPDAGPDVSAAAPELEVSSPARATVLAAGDAAPVFRATAHNGWVVESAAGPRPRALVVYFYPRDETPGCTREACSFRDAFREYNDAGADVVGVSTDTKAAHDAFASHHQLPFGLIADPQGRLARAFGLDPAGGVAPRATFVIGRDGRVARVFPNVRVDGHAGEVLAAVRALR
ncbi:MAG: peroxiredoxin [Polyangiales bacterium]